MVKGVGRTVKTVDGSWPHSGVVVIAAVVYRPFDGRFGRKPLSCSADDDVATMPDSPDLLKSYIADLQFRLDLARATILMLRESQGDEEDE